MTMGANYLFELISTETYAPQFIAHNKLFLGIVQAHMRQVSMAKAKVESIKRKFS